MCSSCFCWLSLGNHLDSWSASPSVSIIFSAPCTSLSMSPGFLHAPLSLISLLKWSSKLIKHTHTHTCARPTKHKPLIDGYTCDLCKYWPFIQAVKCWQPMRWVKPVEYHRFVFPSLQLLSTNCFIRALHHAVIRNDAIRRRSNLIKQTTPNALWSVVVSDHKFFLYWSAKEWWREDKFPSLVIFDICDK